MLEPLDAKVKFAVLLFARSINLFTLLTGNDGAATRMFGTAATSDTRKSLHRVIRHLCIKRHVDRVGLPCPSGKE